MTYSFTLSEDDFLQYQLYTVSKSTRIKRRKQRMWVIAPILFVLLGLLAAYQGKTLYIFYGISAIIWTIFYPYFFSLTYKRHFKKHIKEYYLNKVDKEISIYFSKDSFYSKDSTSEAKISLDELAEINEIANQIFLVTNSGDSLIIPKNMGNFDSLLLELKNVQLNYGISWNQNFDWKWPVF